MPQKTSPKLSRATITWSNNGPHAENFGDIYFSSQDGLAEARHVFLEGIGGASAWNGLDRFKVAELGFGTGLNFLALWDLWRRNAPSRAHLHFFSVEGYPLGVEQLGKAHAGFPELASLASKLRAVYPPLVPGMHHLRLDGGRVTLTLLFGPVLSMLAGLRGAFDAWFLDGFAPSKNPDMWTAGVFEKVALHSVNGTRLSTFSTAGAVRRGLAEYGFRVEKRLGFGGKRECLAAVYEGDAQAELIAPWYRRPKTLANDAHVCVIGAGIAGRAATNVLVQEGYRVSLIDGSPNADDRQDWPNRVLIAPRLVDPSDSYGRFMAQAFVHAAQLDDDNEHLALGALHLPTTPDTLERQTDIAGKMGWADDLARLMTADEASEIAGIELSLGGIHFPTARLVDPDKCIPIASLQYAKVIRARVQALDANTAGWCVRFEEGKVIECDAVVLAMGPWSRALLPSADLSLNVKRGQLAHLPATDMTAQLRLSLSFGGHLTPAFEGPNGARHILGSSYEAWDLDGKGGADTSWQLLRPDDQGAAMESLKTISSGIANQWRLAPLAGWAGLRATTTDHLPLVGPAPDAAGYRMAYAELHHGRRGPHPPAPYLPNAFVLSGFSSRGYQTAHLAAEVLVAHMTGAPMPVPSDVADALHPGRMLIRRLRRQPDVVAD